MRSAKANNPATSDCDLPAAQNTRIITLDDVDLIDVDGLELSDEDSWLYESPKSLTAEQRAISAYGWLRKEPAVLPNQVRRRLITKYEEGSPGLGLGRLPSATTNYEPLLLNGDPTRNSNAYSRGRNQQQAHIDTRTFTRQPRRSEEWRLPVVDSSSCATDQLYDDVGHVQAVARQQQESLRQPTPLTSPKRSSDGSRQSTDRGSPDTDSDHPWTPTEGGSFESRCDCPGSPSSEDLDDARRVAAAATMTRVPAENAALRQRRSLNGPSLPVPAQVRSSRTSTVQQSPVRSPKPNVLQVFRARGTSQSPCRQTSSRSLSPATHCRASPSPDRASPKTVQGHSRIPVPKSARSIPTPTRGTSRLRGCNGDDSWKEGCF